MLGPGLRRLGLFAHVTTSVSFAGAAAAFLALAAVAASMGDGAMAGGLYVGLNVVMGDVLVPLAWASLLLGILQSLGTPWGLFRYYWVVVKLVLTVVATIVLLVQAQSVSATAALAATGDLGTARTARWGMILHASGGLAVLLVLTALSIYKPRGLTAYGVRRSPAPKAGAE